MKNFFIIILMLVIGSAAESQTPQFYNRLPTAGANVFPFNTNPGTGKKVQWAIAAGEFNQPGPAPAGNNITAIWFRPNAACNATYTNLTIRLATVSTSTFIPGIGQWYTGPMVTVRSQNTTITSPAALTWTSIPLTTPFPYDPTMNLIIEVSQCGFTGTGFNINQDVIDVAPNYRRQYSDASSVCGVTVLPTGGQFNVPAIGLDLAPAGCTNTTSNGSATINTAGNVVTISACNFAGDYSTINGAVNGQTLRFTSSVATDFITVRSGTPNGPLLASGTTPLVFANTFTGTIYAHWNTAGCGTQNTCRTTTVQCTNCGTTPCTITRTSAAGTDNQTVCQGGPITNITYNTTIASGATFSGLPPGVTGNMTGSVITISGVPTATGVFNYTVTLVGCPAPTTTATGTITVNAAAPISVVAVPGTTLCAGDPALLTVMEASGPPVPSTVAVTGFLNNNANATILFNFRNNNATAVTITGIESICSTSGLKSVSALYKTSPINGAPGALNAGNGWNQFGSAVITGIGNTTTTTTQPFMTGLTLVVPPGATYGICVQAVNQGTTTAAQRYSSIAAGTYTFSAGGCDIVTGTNIGYGGVAIPGAPTFTPRGFLGKVTVLSGGALVPITTGTYLWSPAAGLSSTTTNPTAASPAATTTYTVNHNNGAGCVRQANITITVNNRPEVTTQPANASACAGGTVSFTVAGTGAGLTYQWQESTNGGVSYSNLANAAPYSGVTTATLTINPVSAAMNNYRYRCVLTGTCAAIGTANISNGAILTANALPTVTVTPASGCGGVAGINGLLLTASGATTYTWAPFTGLYTNATATTPYTGGNAATVYAAPTAYTVYTVTGINSTTGCSNTASAQINYTPPAPTVTPVSVTMCLGDPAVKLKSSSSQQFSASFASGAVNVTIPDGPTLPPVPTSYPAVVSNITASGIPAGAIIAAVRVRFNITHAYVSDLVIALKAPNGQVINLCALANFANPAGANFTNTTFSSASTTTIAPPYTGTYKADLAGATFTAFGFTFPGGPVGYVPTANAWSSLYSTPNGVWSVGLYDAGAPDGGVFNNWSLEIDYIVGVPATPAVWTPAAGLFSDAAALIPYVAGTEVDSVWTRPTPSGVYNYQATVKSLPLSGTIPLPAQAATFTGNVRGYWFTAPSSFTMTSLYVPTDASSANQNIAVIRFNPATPPPAFPGTTNAFTTLFLTQNNGSGAPIPVNIPINAGDVIGILGNRGNVNSYGPTGPSTTNINGIPVTLTRMGMQFQLATTAPQAIWQEPAFAISRVFFSYGLPVPQCTSPARTVVVTVNEPTSVTAQPVNQTICTDKVATFTVAAGGTGPFSYRWQVSTDGGNVFNNISNGGVYAGATTTTLTVTAPPVSMNGYFYRCVITGAAPCTAATSFKVELRVNPLPTVVISASPYTRLMPGLRTTLSSTVTPSPAQTYTWLRNGAAVAGANSGTLNLDVDGMGDYRLTVTDVNGCTNNSNTISILDSVSGKCFIYPNPTSGQFQVRYHSVANNVLPRSLTVYDAQGNRILTQFYTIGRPYDRMDVDLRKSGKGMYWVEIGDMNGNRLTMCRVVIQ
ncbi:MAG: proprotein convertase P-domain-containing protein [Ferruginibacter sp.]|nr:proprotein convertase P-domain-containing protein [Ferruginibacter sp.]MBU9935049.1 proprotein convertase P-domain-containing protein [Ferruginibacter sp.]